MRPLPSQTLVEDSEQCAYLVTERPWYQEGKAAALAEGGIDGMLWSSPYSFSGSNNVGVTVRLLLSSYI